MKQPPSLMTIAPELRNPILELALHDVAEEVQIASSGRTMKQPGLLAVCHQTRSETLPVLQDLVARYTRRIIIDIHDLDFSTAMVYIDKLSQQQRDAVGKNASIRFNLTMGEVGIQYDQVRTQRLQQWIQYVGTNLHGFLAAHFENCGSAYDFEITDRMKDHNRGGVVAEQFVSTPDNEYGASVVVRDDNYVFELYWTVWRAFFKADMIWRLGAWRPTPEFEAEIEARAVRR
ncbi:hypothetical protein LTR56_011604 [Elasticomyces elasticus]|nr:hypothetical protein LTR56_011604 [Elasticomyces elasticus]KAK3656967.1 hypothetical protein LTR22_009468 [Elasticomyces elasticus]KAK4908175.1 hypothetical protein LTR49_022901 [Elasticomyces elasticus]KAK5748147.1 hypothetical protein LTS12_021796 [Elasticomyces elasticus]